MITDVEMIAVSVMPRHRWRKGPMNSDVFLFFLVRMLGRYFPTICKPFLQLHSPTCQEEGSSHMRQCALKVS